MQPYGSNKLKTALDIVRRIDNWPTAIGLRMRKREPGLRLLRFRDGLNVVCRGATRNWDAVHELLFARTYGPAIAHLQRLDRDALVVDLGGNIGLFSLLAAVSHPGAEIHAYEPGPPNLRLFEMNLLANPGFKNRIHLHKKAVGGHQREAEWYFHEANPAGSSLFPGGPAAEKFKVCVDSFADVVASLARPVDLAKIDIEGAEFEVLAETPAQTWI
jgi:FkbM family methyltransferase